MIVMRHDHDGLMASHTERARGVLGHYSWWSWAYITRVDAHLHDIEMTWTQDDVANHYCRALSIWLPL